MASDTYRYVEQIWQVHTQWIQTIENGGINVKAHINGITIEGTPQEIAEYQRLQNEKSVDKLKWNPYAPKQDGQIPLIPQVTSGGTTNMKCTNNGPCYCTGVCQHKTLSEAWNFI